MHLSLRGENSIVVGISPRYRIRLPRDRRSWASSRLSRRFGRAMCLGKGKIDTENYIGPYRPRYLRVDKLIGHIIAS